MRALFDVKYEGQRGQTGMFDEMDHQGHGWQFLMSKLFELPRNEKFVRVLEARQALIKKALARRIRQEARAKLKLRKLSRNLKGPNLGSTEKLRQSFASGSKQEDSPKSRHSDQNSGEEDKGKHSSLHAAADHRGSKSEKKKSKSKA